MGVEKGVQVYNSDIFRGEGKSGNLDHLGRKHLGCGLSRSTHSTLPGPRSPAGCLVVSSPQPPNSTAQGLVTVPSAFLSEENSNSDSDSD